MRIISEWKEIDNWKKTGYILTAILLFIFFIVFLYSDIIVTYRHSIAFLEHLFSGKFFEFYEYTLSHKHSGYPADYFLLIYIIFGVWNLPMWILTKIIGSIPESIALLWCKCIVLVFTWGTMKIIKKILAEIACEDIEFTSFSIMSSLCFAIPIFATGQYDIISMFFILLGIYQCLKDDAISWKVMIIFAVAMPIKMFSVFPYILLVFLKEKRILYIIRDIFVSMLGCVVCALPFINQSAYYEAMSYNEVGVKALLRNTVSGGIAEIPVTLVAFFALCVVAYVLKPKGKRMLGKYTIWLNALFFVFFFIFTEAHPYWSVLLLPFLIMCINNKEHLYISIVLEMVASVCLFVVQAYRYNWVYCSNTMTSLVAKGIQVKYDYLGISNLADLIDKLHLRIGIPVLYAGFAVAAVAVVILNCPWKEETIEISEEMENSHKRVKSTMYLIKPLALAFYCLVTFIVVYII